MASTSSPSSSSSIICASFNQDNSYFAIGTKDGFKIFDSQSGRLCYERVVGAFSIVEMLFSSSLLAVVGAGEQASLSPRRLCLFNTVTGTALRELNFLTTILAVRFNRKRLIVVLQERTYIYDLNNLAILDTIDTVPNTKGLCAFSPTSEGCYLALPASTSKGSVLVYNTMELQSFCQSHSFRRGTYSSTIYSLSFGPSEELPDILLATSSSGSLHVFLLGAMIDQRSKRPYPLLGSMIPDSVNDAFDPAHHVHHEVVPPGIKSYVSVYSAEKVPNASAVSNFRASVFVITHNGYFREYILSVTKLNESSWNLERELNLLDTSVG